MTACACRAYAVTIVEKCRCFRNVAYRHTGDSAGQRRDFRLEKRRLCANRDYSIQSFLSAAGHPPHMSQADVIPFEQSLAPRGTGGEVDGDAQIRAPEDRYHRPPSGRELTPCDHPLAPGLEPPVGSHLVTPRRGYTHHGIYVGRGRVVQYGGLAHGLHRSPVEEVLLAEFAQGRPIRIRAEDSPWFDRDEVVRRARSRIGEDRYHLLDNNCEHFCEWCVRGEHRSHQVDKLVSHRWKVVQRSIDFIARALNARASSRQGTYSGPINPLPTT